MNVMIGFVLFNCGSNEKKKRIQMIRRKNAIQNDSIIVNFVMEKLKDFYFVMNVIFEEIRCKNK